MHDEFHKAAGIACRIILVPIIRLLMRYGMSYKEFAEIAKRAFIEVAAGTSDGKRNTSHIAVKTGISRKQVKKIKNQRPLDVATSRDEGLHHLKVLEHWCTHSEYVDKNGLPRTLQLTSPNSPSLIELIKTVSGDIPHSTIIRELLLSQAVEIDENGNYIALRRSGIYPANNPSAIIKSLAFVGAHVATIDRNFSCKVKPKLFERQTFTVQIPKEKHDQVLEELAMLCDTYLAGLENKLTSLENYQTKNNSDNLLGVGIYTFDFEIKGIRSNQVFSGLFG